MEGKGWGPPSFITILVIYYALNYANVIGRGL